MKQRNIAKTAFLGLSPETMSLLKSYAKPTAIGAGVGAAGMGLADMLGDHSEEESGDRMPNLLKSMAMGGVLGGGVGAGVHSLDNMLQPTLTSDAYNRAKGIKPGDWSMGSALKGVTANSGKAGIGAGILTATGNPIASTRRGFGRFIGAKQDLPKDHPLDKVNLNSYEEGSPAMSRHIANYAKGQGPGVDPKELDKRIVGERAERAKSFDAGRAQIADVADGTGFIPREHLQRLGTQLGPGTPTPLGSQNWNPSSGTAPMSDTEMKYNQARALLNRGADYMTFPEKVKTTAINTLRSLRKAPTGKQPYQYAAPDKVNPANMPRYMRGVPGRDMYDPKAGFRSDMYLPESAAVAHVAGGKKLPMSYGRGRLLAAPLVGLGTWGAGSALHHHLQQNDAEDLFRNLAQYDPARLQAVMDNADEATRAALSQAAGAKQ